MNINPLIERAFTGFTVDGINIPIAYQLYEGNRTAFLTYYTRIERPEEFADDIPIFEGTYGTINVYSKSDFKNLLREVKRILKNNGFTVTDAGPEDFEEDTGFYHIPVNFYFESEVDY